MHLTSHLLVFDRDSLLIFWQHLWIVFFFGQLGRIVAVFSVGLNLKQWKMLKLEVLGGWCGLYGVLPPILSEDVNFRTKQKASKSQECKDIVKASWRVLLVGLSNSQPWELENLIGHQKAMPVIVSQNTIEVDCKVQQWMRYAHHTSQLMLHDAPVAWVHCQLFWSPGADCDTKSARRAKVMAYNPTKNQLSQRNCQYKSI